MDSPDSDTKKTLNILETIYTLLFLLEAMIKIEAKGLVFSSLPIQPYLRNSWNVLDAFVVSASMVDFVSS